MARARQEVGLDDWGGEDFRDGLNALLHFCKEQAGLSQRGRQHLADACVHHLSNRLRIEHFVSRYPAILEEEIRRPMILVTFPRSGSTLLHRLLSQVPGVRTPLYGEMWQPAPPVGQEPSLAEWEARSAQASERFWQPLDAMFPEDAPARASIPGAFEAGECYVLFENSFTSYNYTFDYYIPGYLDWLCRLDFRAAYRYFKKQLQVLQWQVGGHPWCLKCADHLLGMDGLLATFPDANIVMIRRDVTEMVSSLSNLQACYLNLWRGTAMSPEDVGEYCLERYRRVAGAAAGLQRRVAPGQYFELDYRQLVAAPFDSVRSVLEHFDYPIHPEAEAQVLKWVETHPQPRNRHSLDRYGLEESRVRGTLSGYDHHERGKN